MVPPGVHFLSICQLSQTGKLPSYTGRFLSLAEGLVVVMRNDGVVEALVDLADTHEAPHEVARLLSTVHSKYWRVGRPKHLHDSRQPLQRPMMFTCRQTLLYLLPCLGYFWGDKQQYFLHGAHP